MLIPQYGIFTGMLWSFLKLLIFNAPSHFTNKYDAAFKSDFRNDR